MLQVVDRARQLVQAFRVDQDVHGQAVIADAGREVPSVLAVGRVDELRRIGQLRRLQAQGVGHGLPGLGHGRGDPHAVLAVVIELALQIFELGLQLLGFHTDRYSSLGELAGGLIAAFQKGRRLRPQSGIAGRVAGCLPAHRREEVGQFLPGQLARREIDAGLLELPLLAVQGVAALRTHLFAQLFQLLPLALEVAVEVGKAGGLLFLGSLYLVRGMVQHLVLSPRKKQRQRICRRAVFQSVGPVAQ